MKQIIEQFEKRYNNSYKAVVRSKPNWFERVILRKKEGIHELTIPGKVASNRALTARVINHFINLKK